MPAAQLSPQQIAQIGLRIHQDPQLQALAQRIFALSAQSAPQPGETGPASYARTQPAREEATRLTQQYKELANRYAPPGFEVTGLQGPTTDNPDGGPLLFNTENMTTTYVTRAMIIGALGVGAAAALSGAGGATVAGGYSTGAGATGASGTAAALGGYGTVAPVVGGTVAGTVAPAAVGGTVAGTTATGTGATIAGTGLGSELLRYGIGAGGNILGNYLQARAQGQASDAQQKYLEEALAYAKEQDAYNRRVAAEKVQTEASRYADYSGRIAPYLATGSDANARMASVMGLPSPAAYSANPTGPSSTAPRITTQPVPSGPTTVPTPGVPEGAGVPNPYDVSRGTSSAPQTPQSAGGMVHMQAPDGSQRLVPAAQVQHWLSKGAAVVS